MPLYEYRCESCEHQFEVIQKFSDPHVSVCPKCGGGPVVKLISSPAFTFKGTGLYITDYARKDQGQGRAGQGRAADEGSRRPTSSSRSTVRQEHRRQASASEAKPASTDPATASAEQSPDG